jgi:glycosyltransferase involved in cell wall biosynthesis
MAELKRGATVLIISFSDLARDPRVNRQIRFLSQRYQVVAAGLAPPDVPGVRFVPLRFGSKSIGGKLRSLYQLLSGDFDGYYWRQHQIQSALEDLATARPDLVLANDIDTLPLALRLAGEGRVIFDAHEYAPLEFEDLLIFRLFFKRYRMHLCRQFIPEASAMMTVCQSIADTYEQDTGVRPVVVTNAPDFEDLEPAAREPGDQQIRMVHHGGAIRSRKLENMIQMMDHLDERYELDFLLPTPIPAAVKYVAELRELARGKRVRFLDPVPMRELPRFLNRYDVGVFLLEPTNFNYRFALPNKLFEFVQARLAIAVSPSPEMARLVKAYDCGVVARDFTPAAMAERLLQLDRERIAHFKRQAHEAAHELSAGRNRERILELAEAALHQASGGTGGRMLGNVEKSRT